MLITRNGTDWHLITHSLRAIVKATNVATLKGSSIEEKQHSQPLRRPRSGFGGRKLEPASTSRVAEREGRDFQQAAHLTSYLAQGHRQPELPAIEIVQPADMLRRTMLSDDAFAL
jgi:hypothetical protein